jgi:hypothetical protein
MASEADERFAQAKSTTTEEDYPMTTTKTDRINPRHVQQVQQVKQV